MEAGPSTVRADRPLVELAERLGSRGLSSAVVTSPHGRLLGVVRHADVEAQLAGWLGLRGSTIGRLRANRIHARRGERRIACCGCERA